jgi:hypothetical protein
MVQPVRLMNYRLLTTDSNVQITVFKKSVLVWQMYIQFWNNYKRASLNNLLNTVSKFTQNN